jgi:hypothetical protein
LDYPAFGRFPRHGTMREAQKPSFAIFAPFAGFALNPIWRNDRRKTRARSANFILLCATPLLLIHRAR